MWKIELLQLSTAKVDNMKHCKGPLACNPSLYSHFVVYVIEENSIISFPSMYNVLTLEFWRDNQPMDGLTGVSWKNAVFFPFFDKLSRGLVGNRIMCTSLLKL